MVRVDRIRKDLEFLAGITSTPGEGVTRLAFSGEETRAREYLRKEMEAAGLELYRDNAGNLFGRREGRLKDAPVVMFGSHIDSVVHGGAFDGPAGIISALEAMRVIKEQSIETSLPLEMVIMTEEEGGRFGSGVWGSRAMAGRVSREEIFEGRDKEGITKAEAMRSFGLDPEKVRDAERAPGSIRAFLELHIEQGPILENNGKDVGIVESIVGIRTFFVTIRGKADHAGTTPMEFRKDALVGASRVFSEVDTIARRSGKGTVATVGMVNVRPGAFNIVPEEVHFSIDLRASSEEVIEKAAREMKRFLEDQCSEQGLEFLWEERLAVPPVNIDPTIRDVFVQVSEEKNISTHLMASGAGHDAMVMASVAPVGMIFVPSRNGKSHCPEEWTDYEQVAKGADLLLGAVIKLAG
ncbi:MAG: Zn-dependent hydrolase [Synergistales bacterium]|nr:Zn-dependent hydrolase [Synergistales bacterium]